MPGLIKALLSETFLSEGARDRYAQMLQFFPEVDRMLGLDPTEKGGWTWAANNQLHWAMRVLKRSDRITYYLKWLRAAFMDEVKSSREWSMLKDPESRGKILSIDKKVQGSIRKSHPNVTDKNLKDEKAFVSNGQFRNRITHYLSMGINRIEETTWGDDLPVEMINRFHEIEREWQKTRSQFIDMSKDTTAKAVLRFPNGSAWFDLGRASCSQEGDAMGHCGNEPDGANELLTILSFREPQKDGTWRPRMTFILNTDSGMLGEMKGRANKKPVPELHPYIIALLKQPFIRGISGGGYAPEENFSMSDLDDETYKKLVSMKPALGGPWSLYQHDGWSHDLKVMVHNQLNDHDLYHMGYSADKDIWLIDDFDSDLSGLSIDYGGRFASSAHDIAYGNSNIYGTDIVEEIDPHEFTKTEMEEATQRLLSTLIKLGHWEVIRDEVVAEDPQAFEPDGGGLDKDSPKHIWIAAKKQIDMFYDVLSVYDELAAAVSHARLKKVHADIKKSYHEWLEKATKTDGLVFYPRKRPGLQGPVESIIMGAKNETVLKLFDPRNPNNIDNMSLHLKNLTWGDVLGIPKYELPELSGVEFFMEDAVKYWLEETELNLANK